MPRSCPDVSSPHLHRAETFGGRALGKADAGYGWLRVQLEQPGVLLLRCLGPRRAEGSGGSHVRPGPLVWACSSAWSVSMLWIVVRGPVALGASAVSVWLAASDAVGRAVMLINRTTGSASVVPELVYVDVEQAVDWLCAAFGCTELWRAGGHRARIAFGMGVLIVAEADPVFGRAARKRDVPHCHWVLV